jgi:hypothetical protein
VARDERCGHIGALFIRSLTHGSKAHASALFELPAFLSSSECLEVLAAVRRIDPNPQRYRAESLATRTEVDSRSAPVFVRIRERAAPFMRNGERDAHSSYVKATVYAPTLDEPRPVAVSTVATTMPHATGSRALASPHMAPPLPPHRAPPVPPPTPQLPPHRAPHMAPQLLPHMAPPAPPPMTSHMAPPAPPPMTSHMMAPTAPSAHPHIAPPMPLTMAPHIAPPAPSALSAHPHIAPPALLTTVPYAAPSNDHYDSSYWTLVVYLTDVYAQHGGATVFPRLGISIQPVAGKAVCWRNFPDDTRNSRRREFVYGADSPLENDPNMLHRAEPLLSPGPTKVILHVVDY